MVFVMLVVGRDLVQRLTARGVRGPRIIMHFAKLASKRIWFESVLRKPFIQILLEISVKKLKKSTYILESLMAAHSKIVKRWSLHMSKKLYILVFRIEELDKIDTKMFVTYLDHKTHVHRSDGNESG